MGIKGLWSVMTPFSEKKSLYEIQGETVAIDLSGWVCDSQNVTDYHIQPRLYLRNLFFRTLYLLLGDVNPIFVLEGDAPELKKNVMAKRNMIQFRGAAQKSDATTKRKPDVSRNRFHGVLRECESLLQCMGVGCIKGCGEAEATCALLSSKGLVQAVVSQDSDCFAYGAHCVYRNFSVSNSAGGGALQGSVDCYDANKMFEQNGFGRNKMVALAIMCGCDYGVGACGSAIGTVVGFLNTLQDNDVIPRLLSWVTDTEEYERLERWIVAPGRCDKCGHAGRSHGKGGCPICATHRGCNDTGHKVKLADIKRELSLRNKALSCGAPFPEPMIMNEFLKRPDEAIDLEQFKKSAPSLVQFVKLMHNKLDWSERYCVEKFLPLLTRWHLQDNVLTRTIQPVTIKKKRNPRGIPSFEVVWSDLKGYYEGLIPDDQFEENEDRSSIWTTVERQDLMRTYYPNLVNAYEESIKKPPKEKKRRGGKKTVSDVLDKPKRKYNRKKPTIAKSIHSSMNKENKLNISVNVNKLKRKIKTKSTKTIDSFVSKRRKSMKQLMKSFRNSINNMSIKNVDNYIHDNNKENVCVNNFNNSSDLLNFSDDDLNETDLSNIVDTIVNTAPVSKTATVNNKLVRLIFQNKTTSRKSGFRKSVLSEVKNNSSTPLSSPVRKLSDKENASEKFSDCKINTSYFFDKLTDDCDAFELSMDYKDVPDHDVTVNYSLNDLVI